MCSSANLLSVTGKTNLVFDYFSLLLMSWIAVMFIFRYTSIVDTLSLRNLYCNIGLSVEDIWCFQSDLILCVLSWLKFCFLQMERVYEQADQEYDTDMDESGSGGSEDRSPQTHLNGSYRSIYVEEDELSAAEWFSCTHKAKNSGVVWRAQHHVSYSNSCHSFWSAFSCVHCCVIVGFWKHFLLLWICYLSYDIHMDENVKFWIDLYCAERCGVYWMKVLVLRSIFLNRFLCM